MNYEDILKLTNEQLNAEVAKGLGWVIERSVCELREYNDSEGRYRGFVCNYKPSENWDACEHIVLQCKNFMLLKGAVEWVVTVGINVGTGGTAAMAICRAFVLSKQ